MCRKWVNCESNRSSYYIVLKCHTKYVSTVGCKVLYKFQSSNIATIYQVDYHTSLC